LGYGCKKVTLTASGLTCSMCSKAIFKALTKLDFVEEVKVDIEKSIYILTFKTGKKVDIDQIKLAVTGAGFGVQSLVSE
jgi:copper chaperone CopZ